MSEIHLQELVDENLTDQIIDLRDQLDEEDLVPEIEIVNSIPTNNQNVVYYNNVNHISFSTTANWRDIVNNENNENNENIINNRIIN